MRLTCLAAGLALAAAGDLKFTAKSGSTKIEWDGSKLTVPQHCRKETCDSAAATIAALQATDGALRSELHALHALVGTMSSQLSALTETHHEEHGNIASAVADNKGKLAAMEAEYLYADAALADAIDTVTKLEGPKGDKGEKGDDGVAGE